MVSDHPGVFGWRLTHVKHWSGRGVEGRAPLLRQEYICTSRRRSQQRRQRIAREIGGKAGAGGVSEAKRGGGVRTS